MHQAAAGLCVHVLKQGLMLHPACRRQAQTQSLRAARWHLYSQAEVKRFFGCMSVLQSARQPDDHVSAHRSGAWGATDPLLA